MESGAGNTASRGPVGLRFDIAGLLAVTFVFCVMAAGGWYVLEGMKSTSSNRALLVIFVHASPGIALAAAAILRTVYVFIQRLVESRRGASEDADEVFGQ